MGKKLDGYRRLFDSVKKGRVHNLYFLYGPEEYLKREFIRELLVAALPESERAFNLDILYGDEFDRALFDDRIETFPLFAQRRVVILRNFKALSTAARDHVIEAAGHLGESLVLVVETPDERLDTARLRKMKAVADERGMSYAFGYLDEAETIERAVGRLRREGLSVEPEAMDLLVESVGTQLIDLGNEIDKILLAVGDDRRVDRELVGSVVGKYRTESLFGFLDDITRANPGALIERLSTMIDGGEEPVFILTMLLRRVLLLMEVQALEAEHGRAVATGKALAARMAGGASPFYADILRRQARSIEPDRLEVLLVNLRWADRKIKSSAIPARTILEESLIASHTGHALRMTA